jgi:hypothetical protein
MDIVRIVCGVLAAGICLLLIVRRRRRMTE